MQAKFASDLSKFKCVFGGNRSGKSQGVADYVVRRILDKPKQKWWVVGESFADSVAIQQSKIWSLVPKNKIKYGYYDEINGFRNRKLQLINSSLITFKSYDQAREAFQGDDIDGVWFDEEPPFDIYRETRMRLIDRNGEMLISMTSLKGVTELIADIYDDADIIESMLAPLINEVVPRVAEKNGTKFFFLWTTENPVIDQNRTIQEAELLPRDEKKSRIYGLPINMTGRIYMAFSKFIHITTIEHMPEGHYTIYHVLDPHDRKPWAMIWIAVHKTGSIYVIDEYPNKPITEMHSDDKTYAEYAKLIRDKEVEIKELFGCGIHKRILDPNFGNKTVQLAKRQGGQSTTTPKKELQRLGFTFRDGIDAIEAGHLKVRELLHFTRREDTGEITKQPQLMFTDNCTNCITSMSRYSRKEVTTVSGDEKDRVGPQEKYKDHPDCIRYGAMSNLRYVEEIRREPEFKRSY